MIVGGYSLDLYCRYAKTSNGAEAGSVDHAWGTGSGSYAGASKTDCYRQAMKRGWLFKGGDVTCPHCVKSIMADRS